MDSRQHYKILVLDELDTVQQRMAAAPSIQEKLYYFSAAYGVLNRVMNFQPDPILIFAHQVFQTAHQAFQARAAEGGPGVPKFGVAKDMIEGLIASVALFRQAFERDDEEAMRRALQYVGYLAYGTTGNGYYLYLKGQLDLTPPSLEGPASGAIRGEGSK